MKVSIITPTYNSEENILLNIKSVANQTYPNIEHIIIDNFSKDKTIQIIKNQKNIKTKIYQKKTSIYEAMNFGIKKSKGDIVSIIGSDDLFYNENTIASVVKNFKNRNIDILNGGLIFFKKKNLNNIVRKYQFINFKKYYFYRGLMPAHPATFIKKEIYLKYGLYNTKYKICSDFQFFFNLFQHKIKIYFSKEIFVRMKIGGVSTSGIKSYFLICKELSNILSIKNKIKSYFIVFFRFIYKLDEIFFVNKKKYKINSRYSKALDLNLDFTYSVTSNFNKILKKKKFILSALNLAFLAYWYKFNYFHRENNLILWADGLFAKYIKKNLKKIPGREMFCNLKIPKNIKRLIFLGNADKQNIKYVQTKFPDLIAKFIKLPYGDTNSMIKYIPKINIDDLIVLTIPTPKQELLAIKILQYQDAKIICLGGSLNMLSGKEVVPPNYFYDLNLEFLWRLKFDFFRRAKRLIETLFWFLIALIKNAYGNFKVKETY